MTDTQRFGFSPQLHRCRIYRLAHTDVPPLAVKSAPISEPGGRNESAVNCLMQMTARDLFMNKHGRLRLDRDAVLWESVGSL